ncbi:MAG: PEP-CTERM sorting domain-containing protein [Thermoguttaceae bacterium]|nr:PEP-CTERM sorting domain-containing protein [Thermoguttaceae bacterium]MDW8038352.1 PEP-CTERM sorting domain-containing protein [Thermoguttaceae bacterium]
MRVRQKMPLGGLRWAGGAIGAFCALWICTAQADFIVMDKLYAFKDSGLGGAYLNFPNFRDIYIPSGQLPGPYGGWYDGRSHQGSSMYPGHPGYPFQFRNGETDIPLYIFDKEPGGYVPNKLPDGTPNNVAGAASYLRMDALWYYNGQWSGTAKRPPYTPPPNPPSPYTSFWTGPSTTEWPGYKGGNVPGNWLDPNLPAADFLSLPGDPQDPTKRSYVVVGVNGKGFRPSGGNDLLIQSVWQGNGPEQARLYVTTDPNVLTNPHNVPYIYVGTLGGDISGSAYPGYSWITNYYVNLVSKGITYPVLAFKIEGIDKEAASPGFDLSSVQVNEDIIIPWEQAFVPEPASVVLLALGVLGLACWRLCRR